jgi:hypothetical protein
MQLKLCPQCKFFWFDRISYGCTKNESRVTYPSSVQYLVDQAKITCSDFRSLKICDYLTGEKSQVTDRRMAITGEDAESFVDTRILKAKRKIVTGKKEESLPTVNTINKPKRLIRIG